MESNVSEAAPKTQADLKYKDTSHEYKTVKRAAFAANGYVREQSTIFSLQMPTAIMDLCGIYFGYFFTEPSEDPANFVTKKDIQTATQFRDSANHLMKAKRYDNAAMEYTKALSYNINDGKLRSNRSMCFLKLNRIKHALCDAQRAVFNDPLWFKSWLRMAQAFEAMQQYAECLNMIEHARKICRCNADKPNLKLLKKYYVSVARKLEETPAVRINHELDEDRTEWRDCDFNEFMFSENEMSDEDLLDAPPWKIQFYQEAIMPTRLVKRIWKGREGGAEMSEFDRWATRAWIEKLDLFRKINLYKDLLHFDDLIESGRAPFAHGEIWIVGWSANSSLYLNKRVFMISVTSIQHFDPRPSASNYKLVLVENVYCKPNAMQLINFLKMAISNPADTIHHIAEQRIGAESDEESLTARRPPVINVQHRIRDEFDEISSEMAKYGMFCRLLPYEEAVRTCKDYDTHPMGWNYLDMKPRYLYDNDHEM